MCSDWFLNPFFYTHKGSSSILTSPLIYLDHGYCPPIMMINFLTTVFKFPLDSGRNSRIEYRARRVNVTLHGSAGTSFMAMITPTPTQRVTSRNRRQNVWPLPRMRQKILINFQNPLTISALLVHPSNIITRKGGVRYLALDFMRSFQYILSELGKCSVLRQISRVTLRLWPWLRFRFLVLVMCVQLFMGFVQSKIADGLHNLSETVEVTPWHGSVEESEALVS